MSDSSEGKDSVKGKLIQNDHKPNYSSSSSDSDDYDPPLSSKKSRMFGRKQSIHTVLGGGKVADIFLWRNTKVTAGVLSSLTALWILFEVLDYHLLTLSSHILIATLVVLFSWSSMTYAVNRSMPRLPEVLLPEDLVVNVTRSLTHEINGALFTLRQVASGTDIKKLLLVVGCLWVLSVVGSWVSFLTVFYIVFLILCTLPVIYEKYEDEVDDFAVKAKAEINKQYMVLDAKVLQKIPQSPFKVKKLA